MLIEYFKKHQIKIRQFNADQGESKDIDDMLSVDIDQEIQQSQNVDDTKVGGQPSGQRGGQQVSSRGRRVAAVQQPDDDDDDNDDSDFQDSEEEDDSFREGSGNKGSSSDGSEGEEEDMEDDIDDEVIDKHEIAALGSNKLYDKKDRTKK